jgi:hypothetical protein
LQDQPYPNLKIKQNQPKNQTQLQEHTQIQHPKPKHILEGKKKKKREKGYTYREG